MASAAAAAKPDTSAGEKKEKETRNALYACDDGKLQKLRDNKPWVNDPLFFKKVKISPSATMKMLMHANSGVDKGIKKGGKPVEVMGMLLGRPDTTETGALVVSDVFPLPIEGAETRVLSDDQEVMNYMIDLGESLELTRKERFMGWYHSHPFDVETHSHCFLSSTDLSTQLAWQRAEDPHGNPWLAIVVDPLRSLAQKCPEFGAFRAYPPEYSAPDKNRTPDGKSVTDDTLRVERWGSCWNRYCELEIEYFMSSLASNVMGTLTKNYLWMHTLGTTPALDRENRDRFSERVGTVSTKLQQVAASIPQMGRGMGLSTSGLTGDKNDPEESALWKATGTSCELAIEHCQGQMTQLVKSTVFGVQAAKAPELRPQA